MAEEEEDEQGATSEEQGAPVAEDAAPADAEEAPADETADEAPAEEPAAEKPAPKAAAAAPEEPVEVVSPKERRRRERSAHTGEAGPERSVEQRIADRAAGRKTKAAERSRYRKGRGVARRPETDGGTPPADREPGKPKTRQGIVVSSKADKTITVSVDSARRHPAYEKIIRRSNKLTAHDESNEAGEGDVVRVIETRPMSKTKHWRLTEILERAK